jgi:hypothetical protein
VGTGSLPLEIQFGIAPVKSDSINLKLAQGNQISSIGFEFQEEEPEFLDSWLGNSAKDPLKNGPHVVGLPAVPQKLQVLQNKLDGCRELFQAGLKNITGSARILG